MSDDRYLRLFRELANDMPEGCKCSTSPHVPDFNPECPIHGHLSERRTT